MFLSLTAETNIINSKKGKIFAKTFWKTVDKLYDGINDNK
jgi:hypothetical protein